MFPPFRYQAESKISTERFYGGVRRGVLTFCHAPVSCLSSRPQRGPRNRIAAPHTQRDPKGVGGVHSVRRPHIYRTTLHSREDGSHASEGTDISVSSLGIRLASLLEASSSEWRMVLGGLTITLLGIKDSMMFPKNVQRIVSYDHHSPCVSIRRCKGTTVCVCLCFGSGAFLFWFLICYWLGLIHKSSYRTHGNIFPQEEKVASS